MLHNMLVSWLLVFWLAPITKGAYISLGLPHSQ